MRTLPFLIAAAGIVLSLFAPTTSDACSLAAAPRDVQLLADYEGIPPHMEVADAGADSQAPGAVTISAPEITLIANGCDGSGAMCPDIDVLAFNVSASDDVATAEQLRYVASFGDTEAAATSAEPEIIFSPEYSEANKVRAHLGMNGARDGRWFGRETLCFALAAVDPAGNVGPKSQPLCLNTTDESAEYVTVVRGNGCNGFGCSSAGAALPLAFGAAFSVLVLRRRRRAARAALQQGV